MGLCCCRSQFKRQAFHQYSSTSIAVVVSRQLNLIVPPKSFRSPAAKSLSCQPPFAKSPFTPSQIYSYPSPEMLWGMTGYNVLTLIIFPLRLAYLLLVSARLCFCLAKHHHSPPALSSFS
jgi:hypothetical protein